jgi:surfeit locus 1 family protein
VWSFIAIAVALAAVFVRLGIWQLDRLAERTADNRARAARLAEPELRGWDDVPGDRLFWRRVALTGVFDYDREVVLFGRARRGAPGVHVATPLRVADSVAVMVVRGWLPAADGVGAELGAGRPDGGRAAWRQPVTVHGVALPFPAVGSPGAITRTVDGEERLVLRSLDRETIDSRMPYKVAGWFLLASDSVPAGRSLRPVPLPDLGSGPHLSYAIQWFAFALIAIVGAWVFVRRRRDVELPTRPS